MSDVERGMLAQAAAAPGMSIDRAWMESRFGDKPVAAAEDLGMLFPLSPRLRLVPGLREIALEGFDRDKLRESLYEHLATLLNERWLDFDLVQDELGNLLGLLEWAAGSGRHKIVLYLARVLEPYLTLRGLWGARGRALTHLLDSSAVLQDAAARAWGLHQLGVQRLGAGELDQARAMFQQSRDLRLSLGDTEGAAYSQHNLDLLAPPSAPPGGNQAGGGGLAPWGKALLIGGLGLVALLAAGIIGTVAIGGVLSQTPAPTPLPPTDVPTWTPSPPREPTETETITPTPSPSPTPDLLGWRLVPVGNNLSEQAPTACFLSMTVPEIVGTENLEVLQFNAVVEEFVKAEAGRASQELLERFTSEGCPSSEIGWFSDYRVTTWPEDNYLGIEPVEMAAESAVFPSSHLLLSILMLSTYTTPEFTYPPLTYSINYDLNMGRELALEDLFAPGRPYLTRLSLLANETLVGRGLLPEYAKIVTEPRPENYQTWNLTHFGLLMTFNDQQNGFQGLEIGTQRVLIPYRLLADILDPAGPLGDLASQ
jgi:hypothetical protein